MNEIIPLEAENLCECFRFWDFEFNMEKRKRIENDIISGKRSMCLSMRENILQEYLYPLMIKMHVAFRILCGGFMIKRIDNKEEKEKICMEVLEALPEWFEIPESRVSYAKESRDLSFFADVENDVARGFIVMKETSHYAVEICVMGVRKEYHRLGIGSKLFGAFYQDAKEKGYEFIQVKTVREGMYPSYDLTNAFYQKIGFRELECMDGLWDEANPCQVYVMAVKS